MGCYYAYDDYTQVIVISLPAVWNDKGKVKGKCIDSVAMISYIPWSELNHLQYQIQNNPAFYKNLWFLVETFRRYIWVVAVNSDSTPVKIVRTVVNANVWCPKFDSQNEHVVLLWCV